MKTKILIFLTFLFTFPAIAQDNDQLISYYESTTAFVNNKASDKKALAKKIKLKTEKLLHIPRLLDPNTGKKSDEIGFPWAISTDSGVFFNFRYLKEKPSLEMYVKPDITGRFCAVFADKETLGAISANGPHYGGGLQGYLIGESTKWGKNWRSDEGEKIRIFIVDTKNLELKPRKGARDTTWNAAWKTLTSKNLNEIFGLDLSKEEIDKLSSERIKEIIMEKNTEG